MTQSDPSLFSPATAPAGITIDDVGREQMLALLLGLSEIKGIGTKTLNEAFDSGLLLNWWKYEPDELSDQLQRLLKSQHTSSLRFTAEQISPVVETGRQRVNVLAKEQIQFLPKGHSSYPVSLLKIVDPPRWIFIKGRPEILHSRSIIAVIGAREASLEGQRLAYKCGQEFAIRNLIVLSGLARGIDEKAQLGAVDYFGQSIAVLGYGINYTYASASERLLWERILELDGCIISEYFRSDPPSRQRFLRRNELQAALASAVIPVECPTLASGTGATIRRAINIKTPVLGVTPVETEEKSLLATRENLERLGCQIFTLQGSDSERLWNHLKALIPGHTWGDGPQARQDRVIHFIHSAIVKASNKVPIDQAAIDRLVDYLRTHPPIFPSNSGE